MVATMEVKPFKFKTENIEIYNSNHFSVHFYHFEVDEFEHVNMVFWIYNGTGKEVIVKVSEVLINGKPDENIENEEICRIGPNSSGEYVLDFMWSLEPQGKYRLRLYVDLFDIFDNMLGRSYPLYVDLNFDRKKQSSEIIEIENDLGWTNWCVSDLLYEYIKEMTCRHNFAWIQTKLIEKNGVKVFNEICGDRMTEEDITTDGVFLGTIYMGMFASWLRSKGNNTYISEEERNTHYEIVHWNLRSAIGSKYEITQIFSIHKDNKLKNFTLFYSFEEDNLSSFVHKNVDFYKNLTASLEDEESFSRKIVYAINQERAAVFLKIYKDEYGFSYSDEKLDERISKWHNISEKLIDKQESYKHKKLLKTLLVDLELDLSVREYNLLRRLRLTVKDVMSWSKEDIIKSRIGTRGVIALLRKLDSLGLRISDCEKNSYQNIEDYFKAVFVCSCCGKILDYVNENFTRRLICSDCSEKEKRKNSNKNISLRGGFVLNNDNGNQSVVFNMVFQNNTNKPIKISLDDMSLCYNKSITHGKIDNKYPAFVEDYIFPNTERAFERFWEIDNCNFQNGDYLAVYLTDKTNNKTYYFKYLYKDSSFNFDDFYECEL